MLPAIDALAAGPHGAIRTTFGWVLGGSLVLRAGEPSLTMTTPGRRQ